MLWKNARTAVELVTAIGSMLALIFASIIGFLALQEAKKQWAIPGEPEKFHSVIKSDGEKVQLKWKPPTQNADIIGYYETWYSNVKEDRVVLSISGISILPENPLSATFSNLPICWTLRFIRLELLAGTVTKVGCQNQLYVLRIKSMILLLLSRKDALLSIMSY